MSDDESVRRTLNRVIERVAAMNGESPRQMQWMREAAVERADHEAELILKTAHPNGHSDVFYRKRYLKECWDRREKSRAGPLHHCACPVEHNGREHHLSWAYRSHHEGSAIALELIEQLGLYPSALSGHFLLQVEEVMNISSTYYLKYGLTYRREGAADSRSMSPPRPFKEQAAAMRAFLEKAGAWPRVRQNDCLLTVEKARGAA